MGILVSLASRILGARLAARWAKPLAVLLGLVALAILIGGGVLAWNVWIDHHDKAVIADDRAAQDAAITNAQLHAERDLGAAKRARDHAFDDRTHNLQEAADAPITDDNRTALDALGERMRGSR